MSPPPTVSEDRNLEKKRKRAGDVASTSTSVRKETSGRLLLPRTLSLICLRYWTREFDVLCFPSFSTLDFFPSS
jgi:hypothetical protein